MRKHAIFGALVSASIAMLGVHAASAANVNLFEVGDRSDALGSQFEFGYTVTHQSIFGGEDDLRLIGQFFTTSAVGSGGNSVALFEPGQPSNTVSEFFTSNWKVDVDPSGGPFNIATVTIDFGSDPAFCNEPSTGPCPTFAPGLLEDGTFQDLTGILSLPNNITVFAQSELGVPEPATLGVLGLGALGLGIARRKRG